MKFAFRRVSIAMVFLTLFAAIQSASAIAYRFSREWDSGGLLTGSFEIDETPYIPGFPLINYPSLISFQAHWSGDANSDPFDWSLGDMHGPGFTWNIETHSILNMSIGDNGLPTVAYVDGANFLDRRSGSLYFITTTRPLQGQVVPDGGSTLVLLGIALVSLVPLSSTLRRSAASR